MRFVTTIPESDNPEIQARIMRALIEGLASVNETILRYHPLPCLLDSGVRFQAEPTDLPYDEIPDILTLYDRGYGDCAPLTAARIAELRNGGEKATCKIYWRPEHYPMPYHAQVRRANGKVEDIARMLGMTGAAFE